MTIANLSPNEYGPFYTGYLDQVPVDITLRSALDESEALLADYLSSVSEDRVDLAYAPGKWTIKVALQHLIDTERMFSTRLLRLGRRDPAPLPGFDQDDFAAHADVSRRKFGRMVEEFRALRKCTIWLIESLREEDLLFLGEVSEKPMSCRAMGFILAGHTYHHNTIFRERYQPANGGEE